MRVIFIIAVLFLMSCKNDERNPGLNGESDFTETEKSLEEKQILKVILLENGFDQDTVHIVAGEKLLFEGVITTDPRSGSAKALELKLPVSLEVLDIQINKLKKKINLSDSTFLHIDKIANDSIEVFTPINLEGIISKMFVDSKNGLTTTYKNNA